MSGSDALASGFADYLLEADRIERGEEDKASASLRQTEAALRARGLTRAEAQAMIASVKAALSDSAPPAGLSDSAKPAIFAEILTSLRS